MNFYLTFKIKNLWIGGVELACFLNLSMQTSGSDPWPCRVGHLCFLKKETSD